MCLSSVSVFEMRHRARDGDDFLPADVNHICYSTYQHSLLLIGLWKRSRRGRKEREQRRVSFQSLRAVIQYTTGRAADVRHPKPL